MRHDAVLGRPSCDETYSAGSRRNVLAGIGVREAVEPGTVRHGGAIEPPRLSWWRSPGRSGPMVVAGSSLGLTATVPTVQRQRLGANERPGRFDDRRVPPIVGVTLGALGRQAGTCLHHHVGSAGTASTADSIREDRCALRRLISSRLRLRHHCPFLER